jgi:hypothetical protein
MTKLLCGRAKHGSESSFRVHFMPMIDFGTVQRSGYA